MTSTTEEILELNSKKDNNFYYNYPLEEIYNEFSVDPKNGLSSEQALKIPKMD